MRDALAAFENSEAIYPLPPITIEERRELSRRRVEMNIEDVAYPLPPMTHEERVELRRTRERIWKAWAKEPLY